MSLQTPDKIRNLQRKLYCKAKAEPAFRFYVLYGKVCRADILEHAYRLARANAGAPGVDGVTFAAIEETGVEAWLSGLRKELVTKTYRPNPVRRVMIVNRRAILPDDTTVPVLAKGRTITGRCWVYARDDRPFAGRGPPAAMFYYARDRGGEHPRAHLATWSGILQADAYGGYTQLYDTDRKPGPILEAACWAHARRPFFALADIEASARRTAAGKMPAVISPLALEAVRRIDALFEIERTINGKSADERRCVRQERSAPLVASLEAWMREARPALSRGNDVAKAFDYMLKLWPSFTRFLDDGRICLTNNAAERALRGITLGRKSWLFAGSDRSGTRAAALYSLIVTAKMNDIDPQAWLADVLARIAGHPASRLDELLPWSWR